MKYNELCDKLHKLSLDALDDLSINEIMTALDEVKNFMLIQFMHINSEITYDEKRKEEEEGETLLNNKIEATKNVKKGVGG